MDELEQLARARPVAPPSEETVERSRVALILLAGNRSVRTRWTAYLRPRILVPAVAMGLAVAIGITLVMNPGGTATPNVAGSAMSPPVSPSKPPGVRAWDGKNAPQLLLLAAEQAQQETAPGTGIYWVSTVEQGQLIEVGAQNNRYAIMTRRAETTWKPLVPGKDLVYVSRWAGAGPASDRDRSAWQAAGSPASWPIDPPPGCAPDPSRVYTAGAGPETGGRRAPDKQMFRVVGENLTAEQIRALPSNPDALRTWMLGVIKKQNLPRGNPVEVGEALFKTVLTLVLRTPITPAVRGAAFQVLAGVPGIQSLGAVTDQKGRSGVAVSIKTNDTVQEQRANSGGPIEESLMFDPDTGAVLGRQDRALRPADYLSWVPAGAVFSYELVDSVRWTNDEPPAMPPSSLQPVPMTC